jgi:hypothetical protein
VGERKENKKESRIGKRASRKQTKVRGRRMRSGRQQEEGEDKEVV